MTARLVHLRMLEAQLKEVKSATQSEGFLSIQDFIRNAVRAALVEHRKQQAIKGLERLRGSVKKARTLTETEQEALLEKLLREGPSHVLRKHGFDKMPEVGKV